MGPGVKGMESPTIAVKNAFYCRKYIFIILLAPRFVIQMGSLRSPFVERRGLGEPLGSPPL